MSATDYENTNIEVRSSLIIDESSTKTIDKQNLHITAGRPVPSALKYQVADIVKSVLTKSNVILRTHYGDQFVQSELVRFKYIITSDLSAHVADVLLELLYAKLKEQFNIKRIEYLVPPRDQSFILIWM